MIVGGVRLAQLSRPPYVYAAQLERVIDADTLVMRVDLGFHVWHHTTIRLLGWNCPELKEPLGVLAAETVRELFAGAQTVLVQTEKDAQTFARWLCRVRLDGEDLGALLARRGLATPNV